MNTTPGNQDHEIFSRTNQSAMSFGLCGCVRIGYQKYAAMMIMPCETHRESVLKACGA